MARAIVAAVLLGVFSHAFSVVPGQDGTFSVVRQQSVFQLVAGVQSGALAVMQWKNTYNVTGWGELWAKGAAANGSSLEAVCDTYRAGGFGEGFLSADMLWSHYLNTFAENFGGKTAPAALQAFALENWKWTVTEAVARTSAGTRQTGADYTYWATVRCISAQMEGLLEGYNAASPAERQLSLFDILALNMDGDVETLLAKFSPNATALKGRHSGGADPSMPRSFRCSALIRATTGWGDLLMAHATWDSFQAMVRVYKHYSFIAPGVPSDAPRRVAVSFSGSPGFLASVDDFYVTSRGLTVIETTNGVYNRSLFDHCRARGQVMSWMRTMVANIIADTGESWASTFALYNSGTYNNQWIVVDTKRFRRGTPVPDGTLRILEQIPGKVVSKDMSATLRAESYWASYNIPFFPEIYSASGFAEKKAKYGNAWSHDKCPRANIFRARQAAVEDVAGMQRIMRYNDWQHDPLSLGDAGNAISARTDLRTDVKRRFFSGGIDAKVTNVEAAGRLSAWAEAGPTHDQQPVFDWSTAPEGKYSHHGQPARFDWKFVEMAPGWTEL